MGVHYDVVWKDGRKITRKSICFGGMAGSSWTANTSEEQALISRPASEQAFIQFHVGTNIHPMWCYDAPVIKRDWPAGGNSEENKRIAASKFLEELKLVYEDIPMLKGVITIHPLLGVVRAHIKNHQADKIILALFLVRNLANYSNNCFSYRKFRNDGYRPMAAAILAHIFTMDVGAFGNAVWGDNRLGEYNWICPETFGRSSLVNMIRQDENSFGYMQQPWAEQHGYRRDREWSHKEEFRRESRYSGCEWDWSRGEETHYSRNWTGTNYRNFHYLVAAYSVPGDEPISTMTNWNPVSGFNVMTSLRYRDAPSTEVDAVMEIYLRDFNAIWEAEGVSPFSE